MTPEMLSQHRGQGDSPYGGLVQLSIDLEALIDALAKEASVGAVKE